jgi:Ca-activated chloride channel family protein
MRKLTATVVVLLLLLSACSGQDTADTIPLQETRNTTAERPDVDDGAGGRSIIAPPQAEDTLAASAGEAMTDDGFSYRGPETARDVTFEDYGQNPWVHTGDDALSTFAVDVDTGSYTIMRKWIGEGLLPPADSVRTEEYVNFFDLGYEAPSRDTFAVYVDGAHTPFAELEDDYLLRIGIKGREISERRRDPVTLTFVIDVSGSMADGDRLGLVRDSLAILVESLDEDDTVAVVAYNTHADIVLQPTSADEYRTITRAIDRLEPGGSTNAEEGLMLGYDLADEAFDRDGINKVVLLSDGVANVGETGPDGILERISRAADSGIDLLTIGVGLGNYNDVLMEQLADRANGHYRYVDTIDEAERVFADDLTGTLITIARDVKIQVEFDQETVKWYRLVGFENRDVADEDFRNDRVDGGEIGAGHSVTALYQIELEEGVGSRDSLGRVTIRWNDSAGDDFREVSGEITADSLANSWTDTDPHFRLAASVAAYAEALKEVRDRGDYQLEDVADEVDRIANLLDDPDVDDLVRLIDRSTRLFER